MQNSSISALVHKLKAPLVGATAQDERDVDIAMLDYVYTRTAARQWINYVITITFGIPFALFFFPPQSVLLWGISTVTAGLHGAFQWMRYKKQTITHENVANWERIFTIQMSITGLSWSIGPMLLVGQVDGWHVAILSCVLLAVSGVSTALVMGCRPALIGFLCATVWPSTVALVLVHTKEAYMVACLWLVSSVLLMLVGSLFNRNLRELLYAKINLSRSAQEASLAREQAERATATKSQFLANMSHEIRTPMHAVLGMLRLLQNTNLDTRQQDYAGKVEGAAKSLLGLLNDILDFSKIEAQKMELDRHPFRLDRMMEDLSLVLAASANNKPVEVLFDLDPNLPKALYGDAMRLRQVLINLASNAIKFTPAGEVVVKLQLLAFEAEECRVHFSVRDTGVGISAQDQEHIFNEFTQGQRTSPMHIGGTGLGLSISKRLVALMGGDLQVHSVVGEGSTFFFEITLGAAMESLSSASNVAQSGSWLSNMQVLVVDDNTNAKDLMVSMCESWGWSVHSVNSGEAALSEIAQRMRTGGVMFNLILIDWVLPGIDGWQTIAQIRELLATPSFASAALVEPPFIAQTSSPTQASNQAQNQAQNQAPANRSTPPTARGDNPCFIMVSGHGRERLIERTEREIDSLWGYVVKPFTSSMLFDAVMQANLDRSSLRRRSLAVSHKVEHRLAGARLLVVEDNPLSRQVVQELLQLEGATVETASNGQEALALLSKSKHQFDAVLMDLQMPTMDGYAATRAIRKQLGMHNLPIIAITANTMQSDREAVFTAGMNAHVGKPFNIDLLVRVIQKENAVQRKE